MSTDTIAAVATAPGEAGIAIVRVSGPNSLAIAARLFQARSGKNPADLSGYSVRYGRFVATDGEVVDDGLLTVFRAPHSYTGEDSLELSCHGGAVITARVLRLTLEAGARVAQPGEFTQRAFLNGRLDLAQAEAVADLIRARTERAERQARRQLDGILSETVRALRQELVGILAAIEVTIDFSDEVGELEYAPLLQRIQTVRTGVQRLIATAEQGRILREGLRVAIVGRPNVGKSSLLNRLLGTERAIVTPIAGTTRDTLEEAINIGGIPVVLTDTAGLRESTDAVEQIGVERAHSAAAQADLLLWVLNAEEGVTAEDRQISEQFKTNRTPLIVVSNKCDRVNGENRAVMGPFEDTLPYPPTGYLRTSALTGEGIDTLEQMIVRQATANTGMEGEEAVLVTNVRHREALETAEQALIEAESTTTQSLPGDFIAIDVRGALDALGLITGETVTDEIIHRIFHDFCVGK